MKEMRKHLRNFLPKCNEILNYISQHKNTTSRELYKNLNYHTPWSIEYRLKYLEKEKEIISTTDGYRKFWSVL